MSRIISHLAIATAALVAGGLGATAFSSPERERQATTVAARPLPPRVRTVVVTKTIHRVRHVRVHSRRPAPVAAPSPVAAPPPAPVAVAPRSAPVRSPAVSPLRTRTSGHGGGGGEHEGGESGEGGGDD